MSARGSKRESTDARPAAAADTPGKAPDARSSDARSSDAKAAAKPHYHGHRERLRQRLIDKGGEALADYEVLEVLLFAGNPRGDTKPLAKALLARFGSLAAVLAAGPDELKSVKGMGDGAVAGLMATREAATRMAREQAMDRPVISSWDKLLSYVRIQMAEQKVEQFRLLFLDRRNRLIADEAQGKGTVDHTPVYPREVVKRALDLGASALILVHNHPSGDPTPSKADVQMTRDVADAAKRLGISVHDHVIITRSGHTSFKTKGLL
jgi:DNA repair protein RadC